MGQPVDVTVLLTGAQEGNTPLEAVANTTDERVSLNVVTWTNTKNTPYGLTIAELGARSRADPRGYFRLARYLSDHRPDVLHVHPIAIGAGATVIARGLGIPVVTTLHSPRTAHRWSKTIVDSMANTLRSVVVSNSQATADSFATWEKCVLSLAGTNHVVIPYGPNIDQIDACRQSPPPIDLPEGIVIGSVGRLSSEKNLMTLINAMDRIITENPTVHLVIAGEGPQKSHLEEKVLELGLTENIHFLGWLADRKDVFSLYHAIDIFVLPSHYEGFGMANAEAMAAGTPVVVNDIPVLREVVGEAGVRVDATDARELAAGLERLVDDSELRTELGQKARERMQSQFSISRAAEKYAELYVELASETLEGPV